jgi:hypothetical protein
MSDRLPRRGGNGSALDQAAWQARPGVRLAARPFLGACLLDDSLRFDPGTALGVFVAVPPKRDRPLAWPLPAATETATAARIAIARPFMQASLTWLLRRKELPSPSKRRSVRHLLRAGGPGRVARPYQPGMAAARPLALLLLFASASSAGAVVARSHPLGLPSAGALVGGVQLPATGEHFFTWDPVLRRSPDRGWRRYGTDRLVRLVLGVVDDYAAAHPTAPRVGIGDLSRQHGGDFGIRYGWPGHVSHQNGLDVDVYYPRQDGRQRPPDSPVQIARPLAQALVNRFVRAGAVRIFVGPSCSRARKRCRSLVETRQRIGAGPRLAG